MAPSDELPFSQNIQGSNNITGGRDAIGTQINFITDAIRRDSVLGKLLPQIAKVSRTTPNQDYRPLPYSIEEKLDFNNVRSCRETLQEYGEYAGPLDALYDTLDSSRPGLKSQILNYIRAKYLAVKEKELRDGGNPAPPEKKQEIVKQASDEIIAEVTASIRTDITESKDADGLSAEDLELGVQLVVCHAFVECRILENPR